MFFLPYKIQISEFMQADFCPPPPKMFQKKQ